MIFNRLYQTKPTIFHAQGKPEYSTLWSKIQLIANNIQTTIPDNLSVVTFNNGQSFMNKVPGCFEKSVQHQCAVLGQGIKEWQNKLKLRLVVEFLQSCNKPYVLAADSSDVVATTLDGIVDKFVDKDCDILFNAEKIGWPKNTTWEPQHFKEPFCYLNAGVWVGNRDAAIEFFQECLLDAPPEETSEQACIKPIFRKWLPRVKIDDTCSLFQTLNRVDSTVLQINSIPW